ncbi:hypothetical protein PMZ80_004934 [Knufia obscura]|uniref:Uncharacterized protein n=1 Tax=Knufia obscura TaxID=1635080 RepID=A0ABR0RP36_9EURO|nr:hypothetical protein PMZ80_004934 [Knufia obscura]
MSLNMNASLNLSRTCAQHCTRTKPPKQMLNQTRFLTTTRPNLYAQPTSLPTETSSKSIAFTDNQPDLLQPLTHRRRPVPSTRPELQSHPPPSYMHIGTVTRTGTMSQTVQITRHHQVWDKFLQKHYTRPLRLKAHDPNPDGYLREGDIVEYGSYTQAEKDTKLAKDRERVERETERLSAQDSSGKAVRRFKRTEETRRKMRGAKVRGVQFVVRRVVTPFGVGLDERMERLSVGSEFGLRQEASSEGGQDSLVRGLGGNLSRKSGRASVAG